MFSKESAIFFASSIIILALSYFKFPFINPQQLIVGLLIIFLLLVSRYFSLKDKKKLSSFFRFILLFLSSILVQLTVISTGGFFSPFLILLHLFTLATSFLLNLSSSISFLFFSLIILGINTRLDQNMATLFRNDPFSVALYVVSFLVIIPLAQLLMRTYNLKSAISQMLAEHIQIGEKREESILLGLHELVLVTDKDLKIISANEAVERALKLTTADVVGKNLFAVLTLKDKDGVLAKVETLSIDKMLMDKSAHIVEGFYLQTKTNLPEQVSIQIRPIANLEGIVNQIAFVIVAARSVGERQHADLDQAKLRQQSLASELEVAVSPELKLKALLSSKMELDLLTAQELEDHAITQTPSFQDTADFCKQIVGEKQELAGILRVPLQFVLPREEAGEAALLSLKGLASTALPSSVFAVAIDIKWFKMLVSELIDMALLLAAGQPSPQAQLSISRLEDKITIAVMATPTSITNIEKNDLLEEYFGKLPQKTNLRLASGLEGFIAKTIASELAIPLLITVENNQLVFSLQLTRQVQ